MIDTLKKQPSKKIKNQNDSDLEENNDFKENSQRCSIHSRKSFVECDDNVFPLRNLTINFKCFKNSQEEKIYFNPLVTLIGFGALLGVVLYSVILPEESNTSLWNLQASVTRNWTWFYIVTSTIWLICLIYIGIRYGDIKLGRVDEEPEFDNVSYFAMLFSAGMAIGMFFYSVSEPMYYANNFHDIMSNPLNYSNSFIDRYSIPNDSTSTNRFSSSPFKTMDEEDTYAMALVFFSWGLHAWAPYLTVGVSAALATYSYGLPLTMRSTLYPLLGELTFGWLGDIIDGFTIITVVSGVTTSLGLGTTQLVTGLTYIGVDFGNDLNTVYIITIWIITLLATGSVVSGLGNGIKVLSVIAFGTGISLWFFILLLDKTSFLFNLMSESTGSYLQNLPFLSFATDAFGQLNTGDGRDPDNFSANPAFMNSWTVYYFAWWTAWSSFVGLFIARISRGRKLSELVGYSLFAPLMYSIAWFSVFGGAGLRQARAAAEIAYLGYEVENNTGYFLVEGSTNCFNPPTPEQMAKYPNSTYEYGLPGIGPVCLLDSSNSLSAWWNLLNSYYNYGGFLIVVAIFTIAIYFITSSDSGSLVVDQLASNGRFDHHWIQRVLWAILEGAVASSLMSAGGTDALSAVQAASVIAGLPFSFILCYSCISIFSFCSHIDTHGRREDGSLKVTQFHRLDLHQGKKKFMVPISGGVLNYIEWAASFWNIHEELQEYFPMPKSIVNVEFLKGLIVPFVSVFEISKKLDSRGSNSVKSVLFAIVSAISFFGWIVLFGLWSTQPGLNTFAWYCFLVNGFLIAYFRVNVRARYNIEGSLFWDLVCSVVFYPQVLCQIMVELKHNEDNDSETT